MATPNISGAQQSTRTLASFQPDQVRKKRNRSESTLEPGAHELERPYKRFRPDEVKAEIPEAFEQFYRDRSVRVLSFPSPELLKNLEALIVSNLGKIASLTIEQKLSFFPSGEITLRSAWRLSWVNWWGSKVNRINNLSAFGDFVSTYYKNKAKGLVSGT